ncbi:MAG: HD domain-containing protein [Desulfuromusa sp.]|nr:HD domain-containing protein [Desulfuromusa sp.]
MTVLLRKIFFYFPEKIQVKQFPFDFSLLGRLLNLSFGIRIKLALITLGLIALTTFGSSLVVISIMDDFLLQSLFKRGLSIALSAATPAGFSILSNDQLALDNLVAKIKESQPDVAYMTIIDRKGIILADNLIISTGYLFAPSEGPLIKVEQGFSVKKVLHDGLFCYEFEAPINFADNKVGDVIVGLKADSLLQARKEARSKTLWIAILALGFGAAGTLVLASFLTAPIKRLAAGVSRVKSGEKQVEIKITSRDELGELTNSFNEMSKVILTQKESLENYALDLEESYTSMVRILAAALDARDKYTLGHSARVAWLSLLIGTKLGLSEEELKELEMACFLHDIGKIRVPDVILAKEEKLNDEEYKIIRQHPIHGAEILQLSESLHKYIPVVLHHHEWFCGDGYPHGLKGDEIHLYAQIVAIADSYDAMTSSRPYRRVRSKSTAVKEIQRFRGTQFSPQLVDIFVASVNDFDEVKEIHFGAETL